MTVATFTTKVNVGSGQYPLAGWVNVDQHCDAEVQADFREVSFAATEVRMSHVLEHLSWRETVPALKHVRSWMLRGSVLTVEVPDMDLILARGTAHPLWFKYVYGDQSHEGEFHRAGFTLPMLRGAVQDAGFTVRRAVRFNSKHPGREGMPCLLVEATA